MNNSENKGVLNGITVIEMGNFVAAPFAAQILGDFGATVIKIERPGEGDPLRLWGKSSVDHRGVWWCGLNRNKKCITLDMNDPKGQAIAKKLIAKADVLVENYRPGTLEKWGMGPDVLHEINPNLTLMRISGYGQTGPYRDRAGFGSAAEAIGGVMYLTGDPATPPARTGIALGDMCAALFGVIGILMDLYKKAKLKGADGQVIDVALYESIVALMQSAIQDYDKFQFIRERHGASSPGIGPSNIYKSKDGQWVLIAANADTVFKRLTVAMGMPELATDSRFEKATPRGQNYQVLDDIIEAWTESLEKDTILALLNKNGVPCSPLYTGREMISDPQFIAREMVYQFHDDPDYGDIKLQGIVPKMSENPGSIRWLGPKLGENNEEIYRGFLGLSDQEISALKEQSLI